MADNIPGCSHEDRLRTGPVNSEYIEGYSRIDWSKTAEPPKINKEIPTDGKLCCHRRRNQNRHS
jgi:hypothetical protein